MIEIAGWSVIHPAMGDPIELLVRFSDGSYKKTPISTFYALQVAADLLVFARRNLGTETKDA